MSGTPCGRLEGETCYCSGVETTGERAKTLARRILRDTAELEALGHYLVR